MKKTISLLLTLAMIFTMVIGGTTSVFAAESTAATTMKIAGTDGTVTVTNEKGKEIAAKVDTKLSSGYIVKTAAASYCFISLDDSKAIKLGQNTKVKVEKSGKKIELDVKSGEIYFDVDKKLSGGESMNIKTGNMTTGIRGTSGVMIVSHDIYNVGLDATGLNKPGSSNDLFQLFSGTTVVKENNPTSLKSLLGRLLSAVPGSDAKINPIKTPGPITAQAGQQIAIAAAPKGGGETTASRFETQALAVNEFGARAVLEAAAIKAGMPVGEALTVGTAQIVAQVGEGLTQTLAAAGVAQAAVAQVAEAASDPAKLDSAKQNAELQAALAELTNTETIDTAKQEAAKVEGTSTNDKALEKVEVKTDSGANASALSLSEDGTSTTATPTEQAKPSSGSHSGGTSSEQEGLLKVYTGDYDGNPHYIATNLEEISEDYYIWIFKDVNENEPITSDMPIVTIGAFNDRLKEVQEMYNEVKASTANNPDYTLPSYTEYLLTEGGLASGSLEPHFFVENGNSYEYIVEDVADSGFFSYCAISKQEPYTEIRSTIKSTVNRAEVQVRWYEENPDGNGGAEYVEVQNGRVYPSDTLECPAEPMLGIMVNGEFSPIHGTVDIVNAEGTTQPVILEPKVISTYAGGMNFEIAGGMYYLEDSHEVPISETCNLKWTELKAFTWSREPGWITGYKGVYDGDEHPVAEVTAEQNRDYYIFIFERDEQDDPYNNNINRAYFYSLDREWTSQRAQYETVAETLEHVSNTAVSTGSSRKFGGYLYDSEHPEMATGAYSSGLYYYFAVPKDGVNGEIKKGGFEVSIERLPLHTVWKAIVNGVETTVEPGATINQDTHAVGFPVWPEFYMSNGMPIRIEPIEENGFPLESGWYAVMNAPVLNADGSYKISISHLRQVTDKGSSYDEGLYYNYNYTLISDEIEFTYRLAGGSSGGGSGSGSGGTGVTDPATEPQLDTTGVISGFAQGYPRVSHATNGFNIEFQFAEAADTEVYGIFVGNPLQTGTLTSYDVLHGHSIWGNQADALVYCHTDGTATNCTVLFDDWANATDEGYLAFILKQGDVISRVPKYIWSEDVTGNPIDSTAPYIKSAFINSDYSKIYAEVSEDLSVFADGGGFYIAGCEGGITSATVTSASIGNRTHYFVVLGVTEYNGMTGNLGSLSYDGPTATDRSDNELIATSVPIQEATVEIDSVTSNEARSLVRVDLNGRLLDATTYGTYMIKYGTDWDTATQIQGSDMDWTDEIRWNDNHTQQLGTTFFHIKEGRVPSAVPEGRFFVRLNSGSKNMALETIEINSEEFESTATLEATEEPSPSAVYDSSDETLTLTFEEGSMLEAGSSIVGAAMNCRFYIIDGDGNLFRLRGNYTDRGVHSLVFDNTGEYGMSGFGFDPDDVNWDGATLGYTSEIHNDDRYVDYFDELLAADGTIIGELTDIPITVVP